MHLRRVAKERQATSISQGNRQSSVQKRLPVVRVVDDVPHGAFAMDIGNTPVVSDAIPRASLVFRERLTRGTDETTVAWHHDPSMERLTGELINHVGRQTPVGIDQTAIDTQCCSVIALPLTRELFVDQCLEASIDRTFEPNGIRTRCESAACIAKREVRTLLIWVSPIVNDVTGEV